MGTSLISTQELVGRLLYLEPQRTEINAELAKLRTHMKPFSAKIVEPNSSNLDP